MTFYLVPDRTCMCPGVTLEVKSVIEALSTEGAEIPLDVTVTLEMAVEETLQGEEFAADSATKLGGVRLWPQRGHLLGPQELRRLGGHGVLDSEPAVDQFHRGVRRNAEL